MALSVKEAKIKQLQKQFNEKELSKKLKEKDELLQHMKQAFNRLKTTKNAAKFDSLKHSCDSVSFEEFQKKMLQNENVQLQETIINSTENTNDDKNTYSYTTNMRMMVIQLSTKYLPRM